AAWREAPSFTDAERAALALTEAVTRLSDRADRHRTRAAVGPDPGVSGSAAKLEEPADHGGGAQPVGVGVAGVADADERRADAVRAERGLAVVAVGVGSLLVGGGHVQPYRCPWCPVGAGAVGDL